MRRMDSLYYRVKKLKIMSNIKMEHLAYYNLLFCTRSTRRIHLRHFDHILYICNVIRIKQNILTRCKYILPAQLTLLTATQNSKHLVSYFFIFRT